MELPRPLAPWASALELFRPELIPALGPMVQRLHLAIGPLRARGHHTRGELDGYEGIDRRGDYSRLLISEWLLAEEAPDEFVRRATMREQGFLRPAYREPAGARVSVALCDTGPNQLGAPRLAQMAALIVLARRAETAGALFQWGSLQQGMEGLKASWSGSAVLQFLRARTHREATDAGIAELLAEIEVRFGSGDIWILGGKRLARMEAVRGVFYAQIVDPPEPEARRLEVTIHERGQAKPALCLDLPAERECGRLLRDPLAPRDVAPSGASAGSDFLFLREHHRLVTREERDRILVHPVPNSVKAEVSGSPKKYRFGDRPVLAAGRVNRGMALVTLMGEPDMLAIEGVGGQLGKMEPVTFLLPPEMALSLSEQSSTLTPCFYCYQASPESRWLVLLQDRLLQPFGVPERDRVLGVRTLLRSVAACRANYRGAILLGKPITYDQETAPWEPSREIVDTPWTLISYAWDGSHTALRQFEAVQTAFFGDDGGEEETNPDFGLLAIQRSDLSWTLIANKQVALPPPPPDYQVVGAVVLNGGYMYCYCLVLLTPDRFGIALMNVKGIDVVHHTEAEVTRAAVSPYRPDVAYCTEEGDLVVYSLRQRGLLYQAAVGGER